MLVVTTVLILIILEVLYEFVKDAASGTYVEVLILIILEVLYEDMKTSQDFNENFSLNPYYTGSTL